MLDLATLKTQAHAAPGGFWGAATTGAAEADFFRSLSPTRTGAPSAALALAADPALAPPGRSESLSASRPRAAALRIAPVTTARPFVALVDGAALTDTRGRLVRFASAETALARAQRDITRSSERPRAG